MSLENLDTVMSFAVVMLLLSMLITMLVQCAIALSGLRGWNLHYGVIQLLEQLDPNLKGHAKEITKAILEHPSVAHMPVWGGRRKATAIRPQELLRILTDLSKGNSTALQEPAKQAVLTAVKNAGGADPADLTNRIGTVVVELTKMFPTQALAVQDAVNRGLTKANQLQTQVNEWFDTVMDRTTERFILYTRWITVGIAFALAIGLQVDAIQLFKQLSTNAELRAKLIQGADATLKQAGAVLSDTQKPKPLASEAIRAMKDESEEGGDKELVSKAPDDLITRKDGREWLLKTLAEPKLARALVAYEKRFEEVTLMNVKELGASFVEVKSSLDAFGVRIAFHKETDSGANASQRYLGELITALFLSLGAPFWFNTLRQLANLRPAIAGKVEKEAQATR
jgi:hypothetical protein